MIRVLVRVAEMVIELGRSVVKTMSEVQHILRFKTKRNLFYTLLLNKIVGVLTTCHTQNT